jgi:hypothetical protein
VLSDQSNGTFLKRRLDRFAGERLRLALESTGCEPNEDRDGQQALADALVALADTALSGSGSPVSGAQSRPHVSLLLREDTYAALLADQRTRSDGPVDDEPRATAHQATSPAPVALTESGLPVTRTEVARILCDATVARVVVDAHDVPLNVGRDQRLYSGAQRRAVIVRDKQCAWPGCGIPARWAEVHHIRWWARDHGETSVGNGVLLCEHHHHLVHQHDLDIQRHTPPERQRPRPRDGGPGAVPPDGSPPTSAPGVTYTFRTRSGRLVAPASQLAPGSVPVVTAGASPTGRTAAAAATVTPRADRPTPAGPTSTGPAPTGPAPTGPAPTGPENRAPAAASRHPGTSRRALQPWFLDELIAAQPPDPPF